MTLEKNRRNLQSLLEAQIKIVGNSEGETVNAVNRGNTTKIPEGHRQKRKTRGAGHAVTKEYGNRGTEHDHTERNNYAHHISRLVGNAESCHILRLNVAGRKKIAKITTIANLSELSTTLIAIRKCSMPHISERLNWMNHSW